MSKHRPICIQHVKFRKAWDANLIYPSADTDQFESLVDLPRGTLVFLPADEDYPATREEPLKPEELLEHPLVKNMDAMISIMDGSKK